MDIKALAKDAESYIIERRRYYHAHPELSKQEKETRDAIHRDLVALGITDIRDFDNCYGLIAEIHGGKPGKTVALRTDIDGLPVHEETELPFASCCEGVMHACGHDAHIAILLGAAKILMQVKDELCGTVRLIVQPDEETVSGSRLMIEGGALEGVDAIYGAHVWGDMPAPYIDFSAGKRMAYAGLFNITVEGVSAHGSSPHLGADAITAAASIINNLQQYVSRVNDPLNPLVMTIGTIQGGTRCNVIPNHVFMDGTLRSFTKDRHAEVMRQIIENTAAALGVKAKLEYEDVVDPVINTDEHLVQLAQAAVTKLYGEEALYPLPAMMGSEDFANYMSVVPGVFGFVGSKNPEKGCIYTNHHEKYDIDEDILQRGAGVMAQFAVNFLSE